MIKAIALALAEGSKLWNTWLKSRDKRRMETAIDSGERYILVNEKSGEYKNISDARQKQLLRHFSKRFWANNN